MLQMETILLQNEKLQLERGIKRSPGESTTDRRYSTETSNSTVSYFAEYLLRTDDRV